MTACMLLQQLLSCYWHKNSYWSIILIFTSPAVPFYIPWHEIIFLKLFPQSSCILNIYANFVFLDLSVREYELWQNTIVNPQWVFKIHVYLLVAKGRLTTQLNLNFSVSLRKKVLTTYLPHELVLQIILFLYLSICDVVSDCISVPGSVAVSLYECTRLQAFRSWRQFFQLVYLVISPLICLLRADSCSILNLLEYSQFLISGSYSEAFPWSASTFSINDSIQCWQNQKENSLLMYMREEYFKVPKL